MRLPHSKTPYYVSSICDGDPELAEALSSATPGRVVLEFKRVGVWKARGVLQGFAEDKVKLDGIDFKLRLQDHTRMCSIVPQAGVQASIRTQAGHSCTDRAHAKALL